MVTISKEIEMDLSELIEWGWKNDIKSRRFESVNGGVEVFFTDMGRISIDYFVGKGDTFIVEVEYPVDENTKMYQLVEVTENDVILTKNFTSINEEKTSHSIEFHAVINNRLTLLWRDGRLIE